MMTGWCFYVPAPWCFCTPSWLMMYGREAILDQLSTLSLDRGLPILCLLHLPALPLHYQEGKVKRSRLLKQLKQNLVENVTNIYGLVVMLTIFLGSCAFGLHHMWTVRRNTALAVTSLTPTLLPTNIVWALTLMAFSILHPFCTQHALR